MMLHADKCLSLGLPIPENYENQRTYVLRLMISGHKFNTRMARFIGIHNLHSIVSILFKKGYQFNLEHGLVQCPYTLKTPPFNVDIISMTPEQIAHYKRTKAAKK